MSWRFQVSSELANRAGLAWAGLGHVTLPVHRGGRDAYNTGIGCRGVLLCTPCCVGGGGGGDYAGRHDVGAIGGGGGGGGDYVGCHDVGAALLWQAGRTVLVVLYWR